MPKTHLTAVTLAAMLLLSTQAQGANALNFRASLSGDQEAPPVNTDASGSALLHVNQRLTQIRFKLDIRNATALLGAAGAHLHCAPAGDTGPIVVFLAGPFEPGFSGHFQIRATLTDDNIVNDTCGATIADLAAAMADGDVYVNVHSVAFPGGEIRGQIE